jgi:hypothetical protein
MYLAHPQIAIENAGGQPGVAGKLGAELTRYGFVPATLGNASSKKAVAASSVIPLLAQDQPVAEFFSSLLKLPLAPPPQNPSASGASVTIVLGKSYTYSPIQNLLPAPQ